MRPGRFDLRLYRGDARAWRFQAWMDDERTDPADLSEAEAHAQIRGACNQRVLELVTAIEEPNIVWVWLTTEQAEMIVRRGRWDLQLTWPGDQVQTLVQGFVLVENDVTVVVP